MTKVRCVFCKEVSDINEWITTRDDCELCGAHVNYVCPKCGDSDELAYVEVKEE